ncbi:hypothetical protein CZ774_10970 [Frigoribacterium sp. JB110]|nr:hypothetical protein CZ774_10970 [Frigoribacterium sp. JB110]
MALSSLHLAPAWPGTHDRPRRDRVGTARNRGRAVNVRGTARDAPGGPLGLAKTTRVRIVL